MTKEELWQYCFDRKIAYANRVDTDFIWITNEDFQAIRPYFVKEFNIVHAGQSFRSKHYLSHIHAVEQGDCVFIHHDFGNLALFFPLGIFHFFHDVVPFNILAWTRRIPKKSLYKRPK